jgi:hypothetical protein
MSVDDTDPAAAWSLHGRVIELSVIWRLARIDSRDDGTSHRFDDERLAEFWLATRDLANDWLVRIDRLRTNVETCPATRGDSLAAEIILSDLMVRVAATVWGSLEQRHRKEIDPTVDGESPALAKPVLDRIVEQIDHARRRWLELLLVSETRGATWDRWRRRGERWTDLLIGPWLVRWGVGAFAHDPRRAWDFGEDAAQDSPLEQELSTQAFSRAFRHDFPIATWDSETGVRLARIITTLAGADLESDETVTTSSDPAHAWTRELLETLAPQPDEHDHASVNEHSPDPRVEDDGLLARSLRRIIPRKPSP